MGWACVFRLIGCGTARRWEGRAIAPAAVTGSTPPEAKWAPVPWKIHTFAGLVVSGSLTWVRLPSCDQPRNRFGVEG